MSPSIEPVAGTKVLRPSSEPEHQEPTATLLVIGSPKGPTAAITNLLRSERYAVHRLPSATPEALTRYEPALVLVATDLSGIENARMCSQIRQVSTVPIIVLSGHKEEADKVLALELGADDYVILPVGDRELLARVRAQLRRAQIGRGDPDGAQHIGLFLIDRAGRRVCVDSNELRLSPKEFDLLAFLLNAPGRAFTREQLLREVWGYRYYGGIKTVDVHVRWLREKLAPYEPTPFRITTLRGIGYRLDML
jgi:DNA-binding response OmpR family regulator